jgi:hypothetical protein
VKVPHEEELRLIGTLEPLLEKFQRLDLPGSYYHGHDVRLSIVSINQFV